MMILQQTRGALSSGDQLALDLPFAETKSLAARIGPTPTFTRGGGATYVGSDGLIHGVDTSTTSNTIGTGSKTFTLTATAGQDQLWRTGDAVDASNGSNSMVGTVTSYTPSTQVLVCNITSVTGSGTFTSWRIGYRAPRFDHDPVTLASRGLLIEEGRTNLLVHSEDLTQTVWGRNGSTISANATTSPDGATTADGIVDDTTTLQHRVVQSFNAISGTTYTASCFIKRNQVTDFFQIGLASASFGTNSTWFNISNGTIVSSTGTASASTITAFPNGWYRVTHTATCTTSNIAANAFLSPSTSSSTVNYTGTGVLTAYLWGAQVEAGSFPTSYIPTTTSALARSADVCSITGANFTSFYNQPEGTLFSQSFKTSTNTNAFVVHVNDNSFNNGIDLRYNNVSQVAALMNFSNVNQLTGMGTSITSGAVVKQAFGYKLNDCAYPVNGGSPVLDTTASIPTVSQMNIGTAFNNGFSLNGTIAAIRYYKKRLSNQKLQALSA